MTGQKADFLLGILEGVTFALSMQLNIGEFGGARELLRFATTLVKSGDPKKRDYAEKRKSLRAPVWHRFCRF